MRNPVSRLLPPGLWLITSAPVVAAMHFLAVYIITAVACAKGAQPLLARLDTALMLFSAAVLAVVGLIGRKAWRQWRSARSGRPTSFADTGQGRHEFLGLIALMLAVMSFIGIVFVTLPLALTSLCR